MPLGIDGWTVLCLHCDGPDGSTVFTDASPYARAVVAGGDAQVDTAQQKFGTGSALFDGTGDIASVVDAPELNVGAQEFTADLWVRFSSVATDQAFVGQWVSPQRSWRFGFRAGVGLRFLGSADGTTAPVDVSRTWAPNLNQWYHVAAVRTGTTLRMFVDGVQVGADASVATTFFNSTAVVSVGLFGTTDNPFSGWIDEVRLSIGVARWTTTFTPPTQAYSQGLPLFEGSPAVSGFEGQA